VVYLASRPNKPTITPSIAEVTRVPAGYLAKVLQMLSKAGLVRSQRGLHGGFVLNKSPDQLSVLEVINAVDPLKRIERCPLGLEQHESSLCPLHERLDRVVEEAEAAFASFTIQDLISEPTASTPLGLSYTGAGTRAGTESS
jgi:Rrf2 family protein